MKKPKNKHKPRFFSEKPLKKKETIFLSKEEQNHMKVLRIQEGDMIEIVDGKGGCTKIPYKTPLVAHEVQMIEPEKNPSTLICGLLEMSKLSWVIEKATEIGIPRIYLVCTKNSKVSFSDSYRKRINKILIASIKQSKRLHMPEVLFFPNLMQLPVQNPPCYLADVDGEEAHGKLEQGSTLFVGPESGFEEEEKMWIQDTFQAKPISLGKNVLRAETAMILSAWLIASYHDSKQ